MGAYELVFKISIQGEGYGGLRMLLSEHDTAEEAAAAYAKAVAEDVSGRKHEYLMTKEEKTVLHRTTTGARTAKKGKKHNEVDLEDAMAKVTVFNIPSSPHYDRNIKKHGHQCEPCVVCGCPVTRPRYRLHCTDGATWIGLSTLECDPEHCGNAGQSCMGFYAIGPDCLRKHPELKQYVFTT